ncbi:hypothetical protein JVU11DRAFT_9833 [Chiua virens]|nr:hypothetical protein JVU11DRAFT_9833 [Chiua virens]
MGRPDLILPEGGNYITSLHIRADQQGQDFLNVYRKFNTDFVEAYGTFLKRVHRTPEIVEGAESGNKANEASADLDKETTGAQGTSEEGSNEDIEKEELYE